MRSALHCGLLMAVLLAMVSFGCERSESGNDFQQGTINPDNGKPILSFAIGDDHLNLDPQRMTWLHDIRVADMLFTPLLRWKIPEMELEPAAASNWEISDDRKTYTFHLREDGKWSNGDDVTASDFVYAWRRAILADYASSYNQLFFGITGAKAFNQWRQDQQANPKMFKLPAGLTPEQHPNWQEMLKKFDDTVGIKAVDKYTLQVTLDEPVPYFLQLCAFATFFPVHEKSLSKVEAASLQNGFLTKSDDSSKYWSDPEVLVSNGPYVLARRRFKRDVLLLPNPKYFDADKVANGGWLEVINGNPQTQIIEFQQGKFDWLPDIPTSSPIAADLVSQNLPTVHTTPAAGTYFYNFNCQPKLSDGSDNPLADARIRLALSLSIDRKTIVDRVSRLGQPIATTFVPPGVITGYEPPVEAAASYNLDKARELLAEAGYPGGKGLKGLSILYNTGFGHENPAQQIKRAWEENLGVVVELEGVETAKFRELLNNKQYTIARASWFGDYQDPTSYLDKFISNSTNNDAGWKNSQFDQNMLAATLETDPVKRMAILQDAERLMLSEAPIAPIFQYLDVYVYDDTKVKGLEPNPWKFRRLDLVSKVK